MRERIVGTRDEVTRALWAAGRDVVLSSPWVLPDGRWSVLVERTRPRHHPDKPRRTPTPPRQRPAARWWVAAGGGALLAAVGALAWAIWWVTTWVMAHVAEILGGLVALILLGAVLSRAVGGRSGRHCPGPWHR